MCDIVEGAIIKRRALGQHHGVAVMAEGLIEKLDPQELAELQDVERDEHGHIRLAEVDLARKVKVEVQGRFSERGIRLTLTNKQIGYELRCADPIALDAAYCRDLGHSAVRFLAEGGSRRHGVHPGRAAGADSIRRHPRAGHGQDAGANVDIGSDGYRVAREYMLRLGPEDFRDAAWVERLAAAANLSSEQLRARFEYLA